MNWSKIGFVIRLLRMFREIGQKKFSRQVGITKGHLSHIENGTRGPSPETLEQMARVLGIHLTQLFAVLEWHEFQEGPLRNELLKSLQGLEGNQILSLYLGGELRLDDVPEYTLKDILEEEVDVGEELAEN